MSKTNRELVLAYQGGELEALATLWSQVERLARRIVSRYLALARENRAVDNDDLMQAAFLGVERAARAFKPDAGAVFTTVMSFYVRSEFSAVLGLRGGIGRPRLEHYNAQSADEPIPGTEDLSLVDTIPDANQVDEDEELFQEDIRRDVRAAVDRLGAQEAQVIRSYYLGGASTEAIGRRMGVDKAKVGRLRAKGIHTMRHDWRLQRLVKEACCWRHKGVTAFNSSWSSVVEDTVMRWDG